MALLEYGTQRLELPLTRLLGWLALAPGKDYEWRRRQGQPNRHNGIIPSRHWLQSWEREAIIAFARQHRQDGYRRLCYQMIDAEVVACAPSTVYRVLKAAGLLNAWEAKPTRKGQGFVQPTCAHAHWHIDISYLNLQGTFYYLCTLLDGYSRWIVQWVLGEQMTEVEVAILLQAAHEQHPEATPRVISDNGPQFIAKEFKAFIRRSEMSQVHTSPAYPQSNGKLERWHKSLKDECIRPQTPISLEDARQLIGVYVTTYNTERLHSALGYVAPEAKLLGREQHIFAERRRRLQQARQARLTAYQAQLRVPAA